MHKGTLHEAKRSLQFFCLHFQKSQFNSYLTCWMREEPRLFIISPLHMHKLPLWASLHPLFTHLLNQWDKQTELYLSLRASFLDPEKIKNNTFRILLESYHPILSLKYIKHQPHFSHSQALICSKLMFTGGKVLSPRKQLVWWISVFCLFSHILCNSWFSRSICLSSGICLQTAFVILPCSHY